MGVDPLVDGIPDPSRDAFAANQGVPTLLTGRDRPRFEAVFPLLKVKQRRWLSLFAYPLSGGFKSWSLIPHALVRPMLRLEDCLLPLLGPFMGFRLLIVIEKAPAAQ
jgi:hypothetical protein